MNIQQFNHRRLERGTKQRIPLDVTTLPDGSPLRLHALVAAGREQGPLVLVLAGIHGDEYEGVLAIPEIMRRLEPSAMKGTVVAVPVCNVPAFATATRSSPVDGLNMARVFPGHPGGTITQRIAYWLGERIMQHAALIIDLHSAGVAYNLPMLIGYYRPDNAVGRRAEEVGLNFGADVAWAHLDIAPGRTMSFAAEHDIPGVYTEAPGGGRVRPEDLDTFVNGVLNSLQVMGVLADRPRAKSPTHRLVGSGDLDHIIAANHSGLFVSHVRLLDDVRAGDVLGEVRDITGETLEEVRSPASAVVITMRGLLRVHTGDGLFALAQRETVIPSPT
jgi:predicted deacylase